MEPSLHLLPYTQTPHALLQNLTYTRRFTQRHLATIFGGWHCRSRWRPRRRTRPFGWCRRCTKRTWYRGGHSSRNSSRLHIDNTQHSFAFQYFTDFVGIPITTRWRRRRRWWWLRGRPNKGIPERIAQFAEDSLASHGGQHSMLFFLRWRRYRRRWIGRSRQWRLE